jgi:hypothetical protein
MVRRRGVKWEKERRRRRGERYRIIDGGRYKREKKEDK